jgi:hypothetical protein
MFSTSEEVIMKKFIFSMGVICITMSLVFASYYGICAETELRDIPEKLNSQDITTLVKKCNFFDKELNEKGDFPNDFVDNGDGTVTDRGTGLMWEQKGSKKEKSYYFAKKHVKSLNKKKFAGHDDWRIPTIEELYSLLEPNMKKQLYINPVFATKASHCWSTDESNLPIDSSFDRLRNLTLDYKRGTVSDAYAVTLPMGASPPNISSFIRAVRSIE